MDIFLNDYGKSVGRSVVEKIMQLHYSYDALPTEEKLKFAATVGYLYCGLDLVPDIIPVIGFADDVVIVSYVYERCAPYITSVARHNAIDYANLLFQRKERNLDSVESNQIESVQTPSSNPIKPTRNPSEKFPDEIGGIRTLKTF